MSEIILRCRRHDGRSMAALLPWTVEEAALATTGERLSAKFTRTGDLLMFARSRREAEQLLTITDIGGVPVDIVRPPHLNRAQGSIWAAELVQHSTTDLCQGFSSQGVTEVFRPRNDKVLILTFDTKKVPDEVTAAFLVYPVRPVVPLPRRCTKCQRYGHKAPSCRAPFETCAMCGGGATRSRTVRPPQLSVRHAAVLTRPVIPSAPPGSGKRGSSPLSQKAGPRETPGGALRRSGASRRGTPLPQHRLHDPASAQAP